MKIDRQALEFTVTLSGSEAEALFVALDDRLGQRIALNMAEHKLWEALSLCLVAGEPEAEIRGLIHVKKPEDPTDNNLGEYTQERQERRLSNAALVKALEKIAYDERDPIDEPGDRSDLRAAWEWRQIAKEALEDTHA